MRNMTLALNLVLVINAALLLASCWSEPVIEGSGVLVEDTRAVGSFQEVKTSGSVNIEVVIADQTECVVHADDNLAPLIKTELHGKTLVISHKERLKSDHKLVVQLKTPHMTHLDISGAANALLKGADERTFGVSLSGAGNLTAQNIAVEQLDLNISGAGNVAFDGKATELNASISGAGKLDAKELCTQNSAVDINGIGDVSVSVQSKLRTVINGAGNLTYYGDPQVNKEINGVGKAGQGAQKGACGS